MMEAVPNIEKIQDSIPKEIKILTEQNQELIKQNQKMKILLMTLQKQIEFNYQASQQKLGKEKTLIKKTIKRASRIIENVEEIELVNDNYILVKKKDGTYGICKKCPLRKSVDAILNKIGASYAKCYPPNKSQSLTAEELFEDCLIPIEEIDDEELRKQEYGDI